MFTQLYRMFSTPTQLHHIGIIAYQIYEAVTNSNAGTFRNPVISDTEHVSHTLLWR